MRRKLIAGLFALGILGVLSAALMGVSPSSAEADDDASMFEVSITNVTRGQTFTPILVASHKKGVKLFELGSPASEELAMLAESGATTPLSDLLEDMRKVKDVATSGGLLEPGHTVTVTVEAGDGFNYVSVASMLIPTNDAFFALNGVKVPNGGQWLEIGSPAYDAGSEVNDEDCMKIPGPVCGGEGFNTDDGEGYVHVHAGIHGIGDPKVDEAGRDWRNPVAFITVKKVNGDDEDDD